MADNNNLEIVISASDQASAMLESINGKLDKLAQGAADTEAPVKSLGERFTELTGSIEDATQPLANVTAAMLAVETAVTAMGAALIKAAIDEAAQFEQAFTEIQTIIQLPADELAKFEQDILNYAKTSTQSFEQINGAIYNAVSAGVKYEDALTALAEAEKLAVGGNASLEESIKLLTSTTNAYGPAISGAGEAADIFFKTVELGATTVPELNASLGQIVPVAASLGVPLQEVGAAIATLTTNGIATSEAATGLKAALSNIISPSKEAEEAAKALGVEFNASALQSKGLVGLLDELYKATGGNAEEMKKLFGSTEAYTTVMALTNDGAVKLNDNLGKIQNSAGSAQKSFETMSDSLKYVEQRLTNSIDALLKQLGDEVLNEYKSYVESITNVFNTLAESVDAGAFDAPLAIIKQFYQDAADTFNQLATALPDALKQISWTEFEAAMANLSNSLDGLFGDVDLTTPEGLASVLQTLIDVGNGFINVTAGIITGLTPLFDLIGIVIKGFAELSPEIQTAIGVFLGLSTTVNAVAGVVGSFGGIISGAGGLIESFGKLPPAIQAVTVAFAAFELGKQISEWTGLNKVIDESIQSWVGVGETTKATEEGLARLSDGYQRISETTGIVVTSSKELNQAVADGKLVLDASTGSFIRFEDTLDDWGSTAGFASESAIKLAESMFDSGEMSEAAFEQFMSGDQSLESLWLTMDKTATGMTDLGTATKDITQTAAYWGAAIEAVTKQYELGLLSQEQYKTAVKAIDDAAKGAGVNLVTMADQQDKAAKSAKQLADESEKFALEWEKLASAERTALFEARADIEVAQIEADAERTVAAMDMLAQSFQDTGDVLTELIGLWAGLEGMDQQQITEWIEREYQIREDLAQAQIDLVEAEIARMEAQTRLLERGGVELTIQSDGLEPELEAFMFKIIDRVRVAVAGSYEEFLLGCGAGA